MYTPANEEVRRIISAFVELVNRRKSCISCVHFDEPTEGCGLAEGSRPPARIIALGCPRWASDPPF